MKTISILIFTILFSMACEAQNSEVIHVSSAEFNDLISGNDGVLLDVRTIPEFFGGHIPNSEQMNYYAKDFKQSLLMLPKDKPIYIYCNTGYRSRKAANTLVENGYTEVYNLRRGIMEWNLLDLPVVSDPSAGVVQENRMDVPEFQALLQSDKPVLIDFYAPWCAPCRQMMPMVDSLGIEFQNSLQLVKINADASKELMRQIRLGTVPYFALIYRGEVLFSHEGMITRQQLEEVLATNNITR
jgi:rhodanese-related sulfurtransferase